MSGRTRVANQARLVRCSAGCGALVWLAGALPTTADAEFVCRSCTAARAGEVAPTWRCQACGWTGDKAGAGAHEHQHHEGAQTCWPIDEELDSYRALREASA